MSKTDELKRLNELKARVWAYKARSLLEGKKEPDLIDATKIESHRGRQAKALRLLQGYIKFHSIKKEEHHQDKHLYTILKFEESKELATHPKFITQWNEFHEEIFRGTIGSAEEIHDMGYRDIRTMSNESKLYVYWNPSEFDIVVRNKTLIQVYPKALQDTRMKAMMRAIVEQHFQDDFSHKLERYLSLPEDSLKKKTSFYAEVRNFSAYAARFTQEAFFGDKGFLEEYIHFKKYFEALTKNLMKIGHLVKEAGGFKAITGNMRKDSITQIIENAPLCISNEIDDSTIGWYNAKKSFKNPYLNTFILKNSEYLVYDVIYGKDDSIGFISENNRATGVKEISFDPDEQELKVIAHMESEKNECLTKMISKVLQPT